jgi:hypothetical protein
VYSTVNFNWKNVGELTPTGAGTINETIFQHLMIKPTVENATFTMYRDAISPGVPFIAGDGLFLEYTTQL